MSTASPGRHLPLRLAEQARERADWRTRYSEDLDEVDLGELDAAAEDKATPPLRRGRAGR